MGILGRLLLFFYVVAVIAALAAVAGVCLNLIPAQIWQNYLNVILKSHETLMVISIMAVASLCLLCVVFSGKKSAPILSSDVELQKDETGEVKITIEAIVGIVERAALTVNGVREVVASVSKQTGNVPLKIHLDLVLSQGYTAQKVSELVKRSVNDALNVATQISDVPIEIKVTEVTHAIVERERRVV